MLAVLIEGTFFFGGFAYLGAFCAIVTPCCMW